VSVPRGLPTTNPQESILRRLRALEEKVGREHLRISGGAGGETDPVATGQLATHAAEDRTDDVHGLDAELDAIEAVIAAKQGVIQPLTAQFIAGFDTARQNTETFPILVKHLVGIVSSPGENGHINFQVSADGSFSPAGSGRLDAIACRNEINNLDEVGTGGPVWGIVEAGHYWRYERQTITSYTAPDFVTINGVEIIWELGP
jgi:hypothetical protein